MAIEIYHLPPGTGDFRTGLLRKALKGAKAPDYACILYLAPTNHMVKGFRTAFHAEAGECYIPPRAMTLRQFTKKLYNAYGDRTIIPKPLTPALISGMTGCGMGLATLVAELIRELKQQFPSEAPEGIRKRLLRVFSEHDIPEEAARRALEAMDLFARYKEALEKHNALDEDDTLSLSAALAAIMAERDPVHTLMLDGFYEVTPAEELLIRKLVGQAGQAIITIPISGINDDLSYCYSNSLKDYFKVEPAVIPGKEPPASIVYHPAPSTEEEVEDIAKHIKGAFITGRRRDLDNTLLVFPKLSAYRDMVERVFTRYGIPHTVSAPKPLSMSRPYLDLMGLLESVAEDYPRLAFSGFLTSPYFQKIPEEIRNAAPRISLVSGIIKGREAWLNAFRQHGLYATGVSLLKTIEAIKFDSKNESYGTYAEVLLDILRKLEFMPSQEGLTRLEEILRGLGRLDRMVEGGTGLSGFMDALQRILESMHEEEQDGHGVQVAELREVRGLEPAMLYMAGIKDGDIPSRPEMDFLLPDTVRRKLGLVDIKRHMHLEKFIFRRLTSAAGGLYISYPSMEGDKFYLPSVFLAGAGEDTQRPPGIFSEEERMVLGQGPPLSQNIKEIKNIKRFRDGSALRVTDIDAYRACPRRFYIEKVLKFTPPEILGYEIEPMALGSIVHEVMERLMPRAPGDPGSFQEIASETLDEVLRDKDLDIYFKELIKETFLGISPELFEIEAKLKDEGYVFHKAEHEVRGEPLEGIVLKGKVDRIDLGPGGAAEIIDYKTGAVTISSSSTLERGTNLQLFLYAAMLKTLGLHPGRVGIYSLKDVRLKWFPTRRDGKKGLTMDDFIESSLKFLENTAGSMREGDFTAMPIEEQTCRNCPERPYCPYIHGGVHE